jgi:hypothetical protein
MSNAMHMFRKQFPNGWLVDVQHDPDGFNDRYSTDYPYSVMVQNVETGFASFENIETAEEVFKIIADTKKW